MVQHFSDLSVFLLLMNVQLSLVFKELLPLLKLVLLLFDYVLHLSVLTQVANCIDTFIPAA